jgi:protein gp37
MSETTAIEWCRATGGPWLGCTEVSPGCAECYARDLLETRLQWIVRNAYKGLPRTASPARTGGACFRA